MDKHGGIKNHRTELKESFDKEQTVVRVLERVTAKAGCEKNYLPIGIP